MRKLFVHFVSLCGALVVAAAVPAAADPILVTGGELTGRPGAGLAFFTLTGDGFSLSAGSDSFVSPLSRCTPCSPARPLTVGFNSMDSLSADGGFAGEYNGVSYPQTFFNGQLIFTGPSFSTGVLSPSNTTITAPFSMSGTLINYASGGDAFDGGPPVFTASVAGHGTATAQFTMDPPTPGAPPLFDVKTVTYEFSVSPTPEPASLLLLGTGLVGVWWRGLGSRKLPGGGCRSGRAGS
jgi:hypothetical protein